MSDSKAREMLRLTAALLMLVSTVSAACPWDTRGLKDWSDASIWPNDRVPRTNQRVTIPAGTKVVLDVSTAELGSLIIQPGAMLVWGDVDNLTLSTHFMRVKGEFHIGSQSCRFNKNAHIRLLGKTNSGFYVKTEPLMLRKFIEVAPGGTLELHGKKKTSWTKLAQTVRPPAQVPNGMLYDHQTNVVGGERATGLHVIVWNTDGSLVDFAVIRSPYDTFTTFFNTIPNGKVVAMFAFGDDGLGSVPTSLKSAIKAMGGTQITSVARGDSYSFITRKGYTSTTQEFTKKKGQSEHADRGFLKLHLIQSKLVFQVSSSYAEVNQYFRVLHQDVAFPVLTLKDEVINWLKGDEILVTSTDFDWKQAEIRRIIACGKGCTKHQIRVDAAFENMHFGNFTYGVDERAEVALLSRSIKIEGIMEPQCYEYDDADKNMCKLFGKDTFGGHLKIEQNGTAHIRGVELYHMGQQKQIGSYPIHCHLCGDVPGMYLRENSVHHSFSRCFTCHGTNYLEISDNVCYDHLGHGLFVEDGVEQNNLFLNNLIAGTQFGTIHLSDMDKDYCKQHHAKFESNCGDLSSFWLTHPYNNVTGNVAAGGEGKGFMYTLSDRPLALSFEIWNKTKKRHHPKDMPLHFHRNVAHSNKEFGVFLDSKVSTGTGMENKGVVPENGVLQCESEYDPHVNGQPVWVNMSYGTYYKNTVGNMWIKGGNVKVSYSSIADSKEGFSGGTTLFDTGTEVYRSIFIGQTDNTGMPMKKVVPATVTGRDSGVQMSFNESFGGLPTDSLTGVGIYQGPVFIKESYFDQFQDTSFCVEDVPMAKCSKSDILTRLSGAISFKRNTNYPTMTSTYIENNRFAFCDNTSGQHHVFQGPNGVNDWRWQDGNIGIFFRDKDGKLTGTVNSSVVLDRPFYDGPQCLKRPDWGDLLVCPYRYVKLELLGASGNLGGDIKGNYPFMMRRDDRPYHQTFSLSGQIRNEYLLQTQRSFVIDFNNTDRAAEFPNDYKLYGYGVETQDVVRVGLCQPKGVTDYSIYSDYPVILRNNATWVKTLDELDADQTGTALFLDKNKGMLFFKMWSRHQRNNDTQQCPDGHCWNLRITIKGDYNKNIRSCAGYRIKPYTDTSIKTPKTPTVPRCRKEKPTGLGAVDWNNPGFVVQNEYSVDSIQKQDISKSTPRHRGCFAEKTSKTVFLTDLQTKELVEYNKAMTPDICINRCLYRGYAYAGVSRGRRCTCGNAGLDYALRVNGTSSAASSCNLPCVGDAKQSCGGQTYQNVWTTGKD